MKGIRHLQENEIMTNIGKFEMEIGSAMDELEKLLGMN